MLEIDVLTLFPPMVEGPLRESIPGRILERGLATVRVHDLREWGLGRHRTVDDYTYGGGAGMVLRVDVVAAALDALRRPDSIVILLDPVGEPFRQPVAHDLAAASHLIFLCPRYEGVDERVRALVDRELSIGDYVLTGGELGALVIIDAVLRLLPGAIDEASTAEESFAAGLLEYPQFTRPAEFDGQAVPPVLVSGHHEQVRRWRLRESLRRTRDRRPDLLEGRDLTKDEAKAMAELRAEPAEPGRSPRQPTPAPDTGHAPCYPPPSAAPCPGTPSRDLHHPQPRLPPTTDKDPHTVNVLNEIVQDQLRTDLPEIVPGDTVKVSAKVVEGNRERIQVFEGLVMRMRRSGIASTITVRRIASGVGVERTFKIHSPRIEKIEVVRHGQVRRAKLYFLRNRVGKAATTLRERR